MQKILLLFSLILYSSSLPASYYEIGGRGAERLPLYRVKVPLAWTWKEPDPTDTLEDTRKPLAEFIIQEATRVTVHNFPCTELKERIPPQAQIARWKQQFSKLDPVLQRTLQQSFNGFQGLFFEGEGILDGKETLVLGWSLQVGREHFYTLSHPRFPKQMRADITIKATGPKDLMQQHREELISFARSFELIEEIPLPR